MYNKNLEYLLSYDVDDVISQKGVSLRKKMFPLLKKALILSNPYKLKIIRKSELPNNRPLIFLPNHGFKDDLLNAMIVADKHAYTLFGSIDQFFNDIDGQLANLFGVVVVDRDDPKSRETSMAKMQQAIKYGTNILIFPEGCWNLTDNELVMKLYSGFYNIALKTNALIVPIGLHVVGKKCYAIRDKAFDINNLTVDEAKVITRDKLATLTYELMHYATIKTKRNIKINIDGKTYFSESRKHLEKKNLSIKVQWELEKERRKAEPKYYIEEKEENYPYKDKNIISEQELFEVLDEVEITKENSFVLSKTINIKR